MPAKQKQHLNIILFMPDDLQRRFSSFIQTILRFSEPILCSTISSLERIYSKNRPAIVITTYYKHYNKKIHDSFLWFAKLNEANVIVVRYDINVYDRYWAFQLLQGLRHFDDLYRPLFSVVIVGMTINSYLETDLKLNDGEMMVVDKPLASWEKIKDENIYQVKVFGKKIIHVRIFRMGKHNLRLIPDLKLHNGDLFPITNIPESEVVIIGRVVEEYRSIL